MNKKVKPSEDYYDFLPEAVQNSTKIKTISEKNVLAALCFEYISHSVFANEHNGWFFCGLKEIMESAGIEFAQVKRIMTKLEIQKLIERKSGTKNYCTHYRLHPKIVELLPVIERNYDNEPLIEAHNENKTVNEPLIENSSVEIPNEPLDKNRLVKISQDKTYLNVTVNKENVSFSHFEDVTKTHSEPNWRTVILRWEEKILKAKTLKELVDDKDEFKKMAQGKLPVELKEELERVTNRYDWAYARLRNR